MAEQETGFKIQDRIYPVPAIDTFTFDELETLHAYSGLTIGDWGRQFTDEGSPAWEKGSQTPGFQMALLHVAYRRGNPDMPNDEVRSLVRDLVWLDVVEPMLTAEAGEAPLATSGQTNEADRSSGNSPSGNESSTEPGKQPSGTSSPNGSETDANQAAPTGTSGSATSPTSPPLRQVV